MRALPGERSLLASHAIKSDAKPATSANRFVCTVRRKSSPVSFGHTSVQSIRRFTRRTAAFFSRALRPDAPTAAWALSDTCGAGTRRLQQPELEDTNIVQVVDDGRGSMATYELAGLDGGRRKRVDHPTIRRSMDLRGVGAVRAALRPAFSTCVAPREPCRLHSSDADEESELRSRYVQLTVRLGWWRHAVSGAGALRGLRRGRAHRECLGPAGEVSELPRQR